MRTWKLTLGVAAVAIVAAGTFATIKLRPDMLGSTAGAATPPGAFVMPVPVQRVVKQTLPITLDYSARTDSIRSISLQAKASGYIQSQLVPDGSDVKKGDLLYTIDPRDYQAALDQAKAQLQRDNAALDYARSNSARGSELAKSGFLAKDTSEQRTSNQRQAEAAVVMDQAAIRAAELNLSYTEIRAPFSGRLGRNQAPVGTLIGVGGVALNTLVQLDPIYVTFNPSEGDLKQIRQAQTAGVVKADILLPGDTSAEHHGELSFIDNTVDRSTGTILARATIHNTDLTLLPGQYVRIKIAISDKPDVLMVPQVALGSSQLGKYLYVVGAGDKVEQRLVKLGPTHGELVAVYDGIKEDDRIIVGNLQKIGPGAPVHPLSNDQASAAHNVKVD